MSQISLEERVSALEREVARLSKQGDAGRDLAANDWQSTIGMFAGDLIMKEIIEEGRKIRERDRQQAQE